MIRFTIKWCTLQIVIASVSLALVTGYCAYHASALRVISRFNVLQVGMLLGLLVAANAIGAIRLLVMHRRLGLSMSPAKWVRIFVASRFANFYLTQGANLCRAVQLKRGYSFPYSQSVGITGVVMFFDVASVLLVTAVILMIQQSNSWAGPVMLGGAVGMVGPAILLPRMRKGTCPHDSLHSHEWSAWATNMLNVMINVLGSCTRELRTTTFICGLTILVYLTHLVGTYVCLAAFGQGVSLFNAAMLTSAVILSRIVNVVPGNLGISELITGASAGVLMDETMYGIMISAAFRVIDYAVIGSAFLLFRLECLAREYRETNG
jgi:uncharacterized membrane protein YbhN (UPF0104 family)